MSFRIRLSTCFGYGTPEKIVKLLLVDYDLKGYPVIVRLPVSRNERLPHSGSKVFKMANVHARVQKKCVLLRRAGLRPVQLWVPDTRQPSFAKVCFLQAQIAAKADKVDVGTEHLMDKALADLNSWTE